VPSAPRRRPCRMAAAGAGASALQRDDHIHRLRDRRRPPQSAGRYHRHAADHLHRARQHHATGVRKPGPNFALAGTVERDAARSLPWGGTAGTNTVSGVGNTTVQSLAVCGRIPAQTTPSPWALHGRGRRDRPLLSRPASWWMRGQTLRVPQGLTPTTAGQSVLIFSGFACLLCAGSQA
jgi:hypothetical protein